MKIAKVVFQSQLMGSGILVGFFFQAEDGIRDLYVTGVQTCALPISADDIRRLLGATRALVARPCLHVGQEHVEVSLERRARDRSEERRVGKECRSRWTPYY